MSRNRKVWSIMISAGVVVACLATFLAWPGSAPPGAERTEPLPGSAGSKAPAAAAAPRLPGSSPKRDTEMPPQLSGTTRQPASWPLLDPLHDRGAARSAEKNSTANMTDPQTALYAGAEEVERIETPSENPGRIERVRILRTNFKYPLIRVEETVIRDERTGDESAEITAEMVADHIVLKLQPGATREDLERINAKYGTTIRKKMFAPRTYLVAVEGCDVNTVNQMKDAYKAEAGTVAIAEADHIVHIDGAGREGRAGERRR